MKPFANKHPSGHNPGRKGKDPKKSYTIWTSAGPVYVEPMEDKPEEIGYEIPEHTHHGRLTSAGPVIISPMDEKP